MSLTLLNLWCWSCSDEFNRYYVAVVFLTLCLSSLFTESIGIHAFFGAFVFGIVLPRQGTRIRAPLAAPTFTL